MNSIFSVLNFHFFMEMKLNLIFHV